MNFSSPVGAGRSAVLYRPRSPTFPLFVDATHFHSTKGLRQHVRPVGLAPVCQIHLVCSGREREGNVRPELDQGGMLLEEHRKHR